MSDPDESAFFQFMATERSASERTLANYRAALESYRDWRGARDEGWRKAEADNFRDYLFFLLKDGLKKSTIRLRFRARTASRAEHFADGRSACRAAANRCRCEKSAMAADARCGDP